MKTLIAYATKYGSVEKCVNRIKEKLTGEVEIVNLKQSKNTDISKYEQIIIGGSIYAGSIQKEVSGFCTQNLEILKKKKIGLFITCANESSASVQLSNVFPQELLNTAIVKESCGGEYNFSKMNFMEKMIIKMISKAQAKNNPNIKPINTKENMSMLSEKKIDELAYAMNKA